MTPDNQTQDNRGPRTDRRGRASDDGCEGAQGTTGGTLWESVSDEFTAALRPYGGVGGLAVIGGVACCVGLKLVGGAILFSGLATTIGLTTGQTTFVVGGAAGLLFAVFVLRYRHADPAESPT
jgi:hypothetical protein